MVNARSPERSLETKPKLTFEEFLNLDHLFGGTSTRTLINRLKERVRKRNRGRFKAGQKCRLCGERLHGKRPLVEVYSSKAASGWSNPVHRSCLRGVAEQRFSQIFVRPAAPVAEPRRRPHKKEPPRSVSIVCVGEHAPWGSMPNARRLDRGGGSFDSNRRRH